MEKVSCILVAFLVATSIERTRGQTMIGKCNLTAFSGGGMKCQRDMIMALKDNANCSTAYRNETACLNTHVDNCVKDDLLYILKDEIGKLLLLLLYHCGDLGFEVMDINPVILRQVKCDAADLNKMTTCWDDFRETFQRNKSDLSLCRKYAEGKQNCTNLARHACAGICDSISKDQYNPFCDNHMDPPRTSELFDCIFTLGCPLQVVFEEAKKCDIQTYVTNFANDTTPDCSTEDNKFKGCLAANLNPKCFAIQRSAMVSQDVIRALDSISLSKRLFCGPVEAVNADSFHRSVKELANCRPEFFKSAKTCAKPFREVYSKVSSKKSPGVCSAFSEAKKCLNKATQDYCVFNEATMKAAMFDNENPFCEGGKDVLRTEADGKKANAATLFVILCSMVLSFVGQDY
ncbi:uncharacterized protein LOC114966267 [Acropora millepora]|uniref:uncharacterized protein LOC114966267 n=1 Tax=Acropora millepora TaxID=45264 RepID=UPI001CF2B8B2|nr:uncharacterized protein LOC114966267 [Acropora millepora]